MVESNHLNCLEISEWQVWGKAWMGRGRNREFKDRLCDRLMEGMLSEMTDGG